MGDIQISSTARRYIQVGRVVCFSTGANSGRLAVVVEILDHKRALVEGFSEGAPVERQVAALAHVFPTNLSLTIPRGAKTGPVKKVWKESSIEESWKQTKFARKSREQELRKSLNEFQRYKAMRIQKQLSAAYKVRAAQIRSASA